MKLPPFRHDLEIYRGPLAPDGSPTYNIYDPIAGSYFKLSWVEMEIVRHLRKDTTLKNLMEQLKLNSTLHVSKEQLQAFVLQCQTYNLLEVAKSGELFMKAHELSKRQLPLRAVMTYLFFRIPLVKPDPFLTATYPFVKLFLSRVALWIYGFTILAGLFFVLTQWNAFVSTFSYFFQWKGFLTFVLAIIFTKCIHELSHAYVAKKYNLVIPRMGVAFLVLFPVLYTDATDAWRLHDRKKRMAVSAAGVISELVLAGVASILWTFTEVGVWKSTLFVLASTNWIASVFINLNPAIRFDGYYLFSDYLGVENLHARAFSVARQELYRYFFGVYLPDPEPLMRGWERVRLVIFSIYTWIYRISVYTAIALFVYYKFTKVIGVFLFFLEITIFFIWPIVHEGRILIKARDQMGFTPKLKIAAFIGAVFLLWLAIPFPHTLTFPAITIPLNKQILYSQGKGEIVELKGERGASFKKGEPIISIRSKELNRDIALLEEEVKILQKKIDLIQSEQETLPLYLETSTELAKISAELEALKETRKGLTITAKFDGTLYKWDEELRKGQYVKENQVFGGIGDMDRIEAIAFVPERDLSYVAVGDPITFRDDAFGTYKGKIIAIDPVRTYQLLYPQLGSVFGGPLPVIQSQNDLRLVESYYGILIYLPKREGLSIGETGEVVHPGAWYSKLYSGIKNVVQVLLRESDF